MSIVLGVVGVMFFHHTFHERRHLKRRREKATALDRVVRTRKAPSAVFTDLGRDVGTPPTVPSVLAHREGTTDDGKVASTSSRPTTVGEES
jgi:signal peptidase II